MDSNRKHYGIQVTPWTLLLPMRPLFGLRRYELSAPGGRKHRPGSGSTSNNHDGIEGYRRTPLRKETNQSSTEDRNRPFSHQNGRFLSAGEEEEEVSLQEMGDCGGEGDRGLIYTLQP